MKFIYDEEKNKILFQQRGITFEQAIEIIANEGILLDFKHPQIKISESEDNGDSN